MDRNKDIISKFHKLVPDENYGRLGTTFETESRKYFFDTGTGKVFECDEDEYKVLSYLFKYNKLASETDLDDLGKSSCALLLNEPLLQTSLWEKKKSGLSLRWGILTFHRLGSVERITFFF